VHETPDGGIRVQIIDDGVGMPTAWTSPGARASAALVASLARTLGAELRVDSGAAGTTVTLDVPKSARGAY
jgi:signal transduction histidine kinase